MPGLGTELLDYISSSAEGECETHVELGLIFDEEYTGRQSDRKIIPNIWNTSAELLHMVHLAATYTSYIRQS